MRRFLVLAVMIWIAAVPAQGASLGVVLAVDVSASGLALTKDSDWLVDERVYGDEERH
jgi:hypothetical protein